MAKSQQTFNKLEKEKKRKKKKEDKRKKMLARKEAKENGELVTNEFVSCKSNYFLVYIKTCIRKNYKFLFFNTLITSFNLYPFS